MSNSKREQQEQQIRQAAVAANPEILTRTTDEIAAAEAADPAVPRVGLGDVVLAIKKSPNSFTDGEMQRLGAEPERADRAPSKTAEEQARRPKPPAAKPNAAPKAAPKGKKGRKVA